MSIEAEVLKLIRNPKRLRKLAIGLRESGIDTLTLGPLSITLIKPKESPIEPIKTPSLPTPLPMATQAPKTKEQELREYEELLFYSSDPT